MQPIKQLCGIASVLNIENIDTDQIIPAEFLKITHKQGLGQFLFANWRYLTQPTNLLEQKINPDFVLNKVENSNTQILIAGDNFGCGSSREHAAWALFDYGIRVVISTSIADIFFANAIKNGVLPIIVSHQQHEQLVQQNSQKITIDLVQQEINFSDQKMAFNVEPFIKYCFIQGIDQLDFLLSFKQSITQFEAAQLSHMRESSQRGNYEI